MYGLCIVWRGVRIELQTKIKEMSIIAEWDILNKVIELVHKYRRLVWELTLKQMHHNAQYTYANMKSICSTNIQKWSDKWD